MELNGDALAALIGETIQIAANIASALSRSDLLHENERLNLVASMRAMAELMEQLSGDDLPPGLASELQARANDIDSRKKP